MNYWKNLSPENIVAEINGIVYEEEWKEVNGFEKYYLISSFGRVKSLRHGVVMRQHIVSGRGYLAVGFNGNGIDKNYRVHRLVAMNFHPNHMGKPEVNHDDFDKTNNFYKNLFWVTGKENTNHAQRGGRIPIAKPKPEKIERPCLYKKVINTQTGIVYDSVAFLAKLIGGDEKDLKRRIGGERVNNTPYKYLGGKKYKYYEMQYAKDEARFFELREKIFS
jgi:hypothetical protein